MMSNELDTETNAIKKKQTNGKKASGEFHLMSYIKFISMGGVLLCVFQGTCLSQKKTLKHHFRFHSENQPFYLPIFFLHASLWNERSCNSHHSDSIHNEQWTLRFTWWMNKKKLEKFAFVWNSRYTPDSERMMYVSRIQPNAICITNPQESTLLFNLSLASNPIVNTNLHVHLFWSQTFFNSFEVKSLHWTIRGYYL